MHPSEAGSNYEVVEFQGKEPPRHIQKSLKDTALLKANLEWFRSEPHGRAWEALCAVMAALATRKEKCWLDANDREELDSKLGPKLRHAGAGEQRREEIRSYIEESSFSG